ncbi:MAG: flagellar hook-length control protein FliK, partial [Acidothermaceae bacterium]
QAGGTKVASTSATTLDKASVALARALAALPQNAAGSATSPAAATPATAQPGDAIPVQLLHATAKTTPGALPALPGSSALPANTVGALDQAVAGSPAAPAMTPQALQALQAAQAAQATQAALATQSLPPALADSDAAKESAARAKAPTGTPQKSALQPATAAVGADAQTPAPAATALAVANAVTDGRHDGDSSSDSKGKSDTSAPAAPAPSELKQSPAESSFAAVLQLPTAAPATSIAQPSQQLAAQPQAVPVPDQIVQVVAPLRTAGDGNYTISLQLHPADLGPVTVHVSVEQGVLSVHLGSDEAHGRDALTNSISDLRNQLQAGGVRVGGIDVGTQASLRQGGGQNAGNQSAAGQGNQNQQQLQQHSHSGQGDRRQNGDPSAFASWTGNDGGAGSGNNSGSGNGSTAANQHAAAVQRSGAAVDVRTPGENSADRALGIGPTDDAALDVRI